MKNLWRRFLFHLLPKDIKRELKNEMKLDLEHLKQLGLIEVNDIGAKLTSKGAACILQTRHLENSKDI